MRNGTEMHPRLLSTRPIANKYGAKFITEVAREFVIGE
jgi:hypothetical protein